VIVIDANVISELMRAAPDAAVVAWLRKNAALIAIPSVAIGELRYGVTRLPEGRRRQSLQSALDALVDRFASALLSYDILAANACAAILADAERAGGPMSLADAQIAAIARVAQASLATRNTNDFATTKLRLINPWTAV